MKSFAANERIVTRNDLFAAMIIAGACAMVFGQTLGHSFINYDDAEYVTDNAAVRQGLTAAGLRWAFTHPHGGNWHPLTTLSHMLDVTLFGLRPGGHHVVNILWHAASAFLLYLFFRQTTGYSGRSLVLALLFAVHPLRAESVAWISSRKDTLSAFFWFATMLAYARYARAPQGRRYAPVAVFTALGLMAKPMVVTLPLALLLLDYWPLRRWRGAADAEKDEAPVLSSRTDVGETSFHVKRSFPHAPFKKNGVLALEKIPLLLLSLGAGLATIWAQSSSEAVRKFEEFPLDVRLANAALSYWRYLGKAVWPGGLIPFYPHPGGAVSYSWAVVAAIALLAVTALAARWARRAPYVFVGWLWYGITLLPVIGVLQVGDQAMADRYTYLPLVGVFAAAVWGVAGIGTQGPAWRRALSVTAVAVILALGSLAWRQTAYWRDSETLWRHAVAVTPDSPLALANLGEALVAGGKRAEAIETLEKALRLDPRLREAHTNWGRALAEQGRFEEAIAHYEAELAANPGHPIANVNLGNALLATGGLAAARARFEKALEARPDLAAAHNGLGAALMLEGRAAEAEKHFREALRWAPDSAPELTNLAAVRLELGDREEARALCERALAADPSYAKAKALMKELDGKK